MNAVESHQYRRNPDFNGETQEGFGIYQVTQKKGRRWSTSAAFLKPARHRPNLTVITNAQVTKIQLQDQKATGVTYQVKGQSISIAAKREVLLSAGAIQSPHILLLSCIGPADELAQHNISLHHNLPGVGKNLQDHAAIQKFVRTKSRKPYGMSWAAIPSQALSVFEYIFRRRGLFASNMVEGGGFIKTDPTIDHPDIQYIFVPGLRLPGKVISPGHGFQITTVLLKPKSLGEITLSNNDPRERPVIDPNFFADEDDLEIIIRGFKESRKIGAAAQFDIYQGAEILPGENCKSDADLREYVLNNSQTIFHPVGTCKMGEDDMAVVDSHLKVHGIQNLRVIDASIMPTIVSGNTNAPVIMIAEKAADMIKEDAKA